jgi:hypothetical protein
MRCPIVFGVLDAPMTAMCCGFRMGSRDPTAEYAAESETTNVIP